jgi:hypothetical protein
MVSVVMAPVDLRSVKRACRAHGDEMEIEVIDRAVPPVAVLSIEDVPLARP